MVVKWIIFDWKGTLANLSNPSRYAWALTANLKILKKHGIRISKSSLEQARLEAETKLHSAYYGRVERHRPGFFFRLVCNILQNPISWKKAEEMDAMFTVAYDRRATLAPGAHKLLNSLHERGVRLAIISNTRKARLARQLKTTQTNAYFDMIITSYEVGGEKSSLKPFRAFLRQANRILPALPTECIVVGNREDEDIQAGKLGFQTILITNKSTKSSADYLARNLSEVKLILNKII